MVFFAPTTLVVLEGSIEVFYMFFYIFYWKICRSLLWKCYFIDLLLVSTKNVFFLWVIMDLCWRRWFHLRSIINYIMIFIFSIVNWLFFLNKTTKTIQYQSFIYHEISRSWSMSFRIWIYVWMYIYGALYDFRRRRLLISSIQKLINLSDVQQMCNKISQVISEG